MECGNALLQLPLIAGANPLLRKRGESKDSLPSNDGGDGVADAPPPREPITMDSELKLAIGSDGINEVICDVSEVRRKDVKDQLIANWNLMVAARLEIAGPEWLTPAERKFRLRLAHWLLTKGNSADPTTDWIAKMAKTFKDNERKHRRKA